MNNPTMFKWIGAACVALMLCVAPAAAQTQKVSVPWLPQGKISAGIAVTAASAATQLPTSGMAAWICNTGASDVFLAFGTANTVTATTTAGSWLKAGNGVTYDLNPQATVRNGWVAAITASATSTLTVETGTGTGPATCSSSSTGGGGGTANASATQIQGNAQGTTGAVVGTLAAAAGKTTYMCDFDVAAIGGTASVGPVTIAGLLGGSKVYQVSSSVGGVLLSKNFSPCLPASAPNTAITITTTADATASAVDVNSSGFQQ